MMYWCKQRGAKSKSKTSIQNCIRDLNINLVDILKKYSWFLNRFFMDNRIFISVEPAQLAPALELFHSLFLKIEKVDDSKVSTPYKLNKYKTV